HRRLRSFPTRRSSDLVVLVALRVPREAQFLQSTAARPFVLCGQQSLEIFCLGIILSVLVHFILTEYGGGVWMQLAANAAGITVRSEEHTSELQSLAYL